MTYWGGVGLIARPVTKTGAKAVHSVIDPAQNFKWVFMWVKNQQAS